MTTWTLEKAKNGFSEVVRRALNHQPQLVTRGRGGDDAVVVLAKADYERLVAPQNFVDFLRNSPMAEAVAERAFGDFGDPSAHDPSAHDPFARPRDLGRSLDLV